MENTPNYYAIIPANVRYDTRLSASCKLLYGEITALCNAKGYCWASNQYFAELYDVSLNSVSRWIGTLVETGYLKREMIYKEGTAEIQERRLYIEEKCVDPLYKNVDTPIQKCVDPLYKNVDTPIQKCVDPLYKNVEDNNKFNNKYNNKYNSVTQSETNTKKLIQTKTKRTKKVEELQTMKSMINCFSDNIDIQDKLLEYFNIRVKKGLQINQWKIILDDLHNFTKNKDEIIDKLNNAIAGGYMQIIASWEKNKRVNSRFDNTKKEKPRALADMTDEELQNYYDNELARDENGKIIKF